MTAGTRARAIGILGGGQLGRMLAMAGARLGLRTVVLASEDDSPAAAVSADRIIADCRDVEALDRLADACDVITFETENVPIDAARRLAALKPVFPPPRALETAQDRLAEKRFLRACGIPTADFIAVGSRAEADAALASLGGAGILKTRRFGYDGNGQKRFDRPSRATAGAFAELGGGPMIMESLVAFTSEISVIAARGQDGRAVAYDPAENRHEGGILRSSTIPARASPALIDTAIAATRTILERLEYVGVIAVEFFVTADGDVIANEFAPRVHNSGHWTEAACLVSQFEQHIRAICGLPLGGTARRGDCEMRNMIGSEVNRFAELLDEPQTLVHLYGKAEARPRRKMGHFVRMHGGARPAPVVDTRARADYTGR